MGDLSGEYDSDPGYANFLLAAGLHVYSRIRLGTGSLFGLIYILPSIF